MPCRRRLLYGIDTFVCRLVDLWGEETGLVGGREMRRRHDWKRFLLVTALILGLVWTGLDSHPVEACSGPGVSLSTMADHSDAIVKATVLSVDSLSTNGILRVERYFKASGAEFLLLVQV